MKSFLFNKNSAQVVYKDANCHFDLNWVMRSESFN
jgi:hypothetical protein